MKNKSIKNKSIQKSIRFPTEFVKLIEKIAEIENRTFPNLINKIVGDHFKAYSIFTDTANDKNRYSSKEKEIVDLINKWNS